MLFWSHNWALYSRIAYLPEITLSYVSDIRNLLKVMPKKFESALIKFQIVQNSQKN
jgi:hypothetical protein